MVAYFKHPHHTLNHFINKGLFFSYLLHISRLLFVSIFSVRVFFYSHHHHFVSREVKIQFTVNLTFAWRVYIYLYMWTLHQLTVDRMPKPTREKKNTLLSFVTWTFIVDYSWWIFIMIANINTRIYIRRLRFLFWFIFDSIVWSFSLCADQSSTVDRSRIRAKNPFFLYLVRVWASKSLHWCVKTDSSQRYCQR